MLLKLAKIKNLGVFDNYSWGSALAPLGRYNVIYGDNGSGKTTLARLLDCLKAGSHQEYPDLEYCISTQSGDLVQGHPATRNIRVFNADYVDLNVGKLDGSMKPILVIGEENKAVAESLALDQKELARRQEIIRLARIKKSALETSKGKVFTAIAKTISEAISGSAVRNYRKNNAEAGLSSLHGDASLSEAELAETRATLAQTAMDAISHLNFPTVSYRTATVPLDQALIELSDEARRLCLRSAAVQVIDRLQANAELSQWVETGYTLHKDLGVEDCEFCGGHVPADRWRQLQSFFNNEDQELKAALDRCVSDKTIIERGLDLFHLPDRLAFYPELRDTYDAHKAEWDAAIIQVRREVQAVADCIAAKISSRSTPMSCEVNGNIPALRNAFSSVETLIDRNNESLKGFRLKKPPLEPSWNSII